MSCLSRCPYFRGVLNEGFHCIYIAVLHSSLSSPIQNRECNGLQTQHIPLEYACLERCVASQSMYMYNVYAVTCIRTCTYHIHTIAPYSGTSLIRTTLRQKKVSLLARCPDFRGCSVHKQGVWDSQNVSCLLRCPYFRGVLNEGFHCIHENLGPVDFDHM